MTDIESLKAEFHERVANPNDYHVLMASWCFSNAPKLFDEITSLRKQLEEARGALRQISRPDISGNPECSREAMFEIASRLMKGQQHG